MSIDIGRKMWDAVPMPAERIMGRGVCSFLEISASFGRYAVRSRVIWQFVQTGYSKYNL